MGVTFQMTFPSAVVLAKAAFVARLAAQTLQAAVQFGLA